MGAPIFPTTEQILDVLMSELPDGTYPTDRADDPDPDKRSVSSCELRAQAQIIAEFYSKLQTVFEDKFLSTVSSEGLKKWDKVLFNSIQDASLDFQARKANAIAKYRLRGSISYGTLNSLVHSFLDPLGINFDLITWSGYNGGAWRFGASPLGAETYEVQKDPIYGDTDDATRLTAFTYEILIYGTADATTLSLLDAALTKTEKATVRHVLTNGATPAP